MKNWVLSFKLGGPFKFWWQFFRYCYCCYWFWPPEGQFCVQWLTPWPCIVRTFPTKIPRLATPVHSEIYFPKWATITTIVEAHLVVNYSMIQWFMIQWFNDSMMAFCWWNLVNGHTLFNKAYHAHHCYPQKYGAVLVDASIQVSSSSSGMKISSSSSTTNSVTVHSPNTLFFSETKHWSFSAY